MSIHPAAKRGENDAKKKLQTSETLLESGTRPHHPRGTRFTPRDRIARRSDVTDNRANPSAFHSQKRLEYEKLVGMDERRQTLRYRVRFVSDRDGSSGPTVPQDCGKEISFVRGSRPDSSRILYRSVCAKKTNCEKRRNCQRECCCCCECSLHVEFSEVDAKNRPILLTFRIPEDLLLSSTKAPISRNCYTISRAPLNRPNCLGRF